MADAKEKKDTVKVTTLRYHTNSGKEYHEGDTYDVPADQVANLEAQGMAQPTTEAAAAKPANASKPVKPMTSHNTPLAHAKPKK